MASPSIQKGKVYVGSFDQNLHCLDAESGSLHWRLDKKFIITSKVLVDRDFLYLTDGGNKLNCLSAKDGSLIWKYESGLSWISVWLDSSPSISSGRVYFGSNDNTLYCIDMERPALTSPGTLTGNCS